MSESPTAASSLLDQAKDLFLSRSFDSPANSPPPTTNTSDASFESSRSSQNSDRVSDGQIARTGFAHVVTSRLKLFFSIWQDLLCLWPIAKQHCCEAER